MRAVVQRVSAASVEVAGAIVGRITGGILVYLGVGAADTERDLDYLAGKIAGLRIFPDDRHHMNRSVVEAGGAALVVSQFTLYGDARKGKRPSFSGAMAPERADALYRMFCDALTGHGLQVERGVFGATMNVVATNAGPVTILLDSEKRF